MGLLGQGVRAAVGLKKAGALGGTPSQQSEFSAAYFALSLMIGFIAGVLAGLALDLHNFVSVNLADTKLLLGVAASGYAGADFIENSLSIFLPPSGTKTTQSATPVGPVTLSLLPGNIATPQGTALVALPLREVSAVVPDGSTDLAAALSVVAPHVQQSRWLAPLLAAFSKYDLNNNRRRAAAVGQFLVEAGSGFQEIVENLNYTHAERISEVFPHEFPTPESAQAFVGNPQALANRVYANKLGNGDEQSGDGYLFRGRGLIQLTGRDEYAEFGATVGKSATDAAALCQSVEGAALSGCWYLASRGCLPLADAWELSRITLKVNGPAMRGNAQRIAFAEEMLRQLGG
jgi:predicted chitinase